MTASKTPTQIKGLDIDAVNNSWSAHQCCESLPTQHFFARGIWEADLELWQSDNAVFSASEWAVLIELSFTFMGMWKCMGTAIMQSPQLVKAQNNVDCFTANLDWPVPQWRLEMEASALPCGLCPAGNCCANWPLLLKAADILSLHTALGQWLLAAHHFHLWQANSQQGLPRRPFQLNCSWQLT